MWLNHAIQDYTGAFDETRDCKEGLDMKPM